MIRNKETKEKTKMKLVDRCGAKKDGKRMEDEMKERMIGVERMDGLKGR